MQQRPIQPEPWRSAFRLSAVVVLWRVACCPFLGSLHEPLIIISNSEHGPLGFEIVYLLRQSASFLSAVEPVLGIVDWMLGH
jgi:hypothetical protein